MFDATPTNMTEVLVACLAIAAVFMMVVKKRYDTNLPLLFYVIAMIFTRQFDRPVNPMIMYGGLAFALLLRFEFIGGSLMKLVSFLAVCGLISMICVMLSDVIV